jgi:hypothetical protein
VHGRQHIVIHISLPAFDPDRGVIESVISGFSASSLPSRSLKEIIFCVVRNFLYSI